MATPDALPTNPDTVPFKTDYRFDKNAYLTLKKRLNHGVPENLPRDQITVEWKGKKFTFNKSDCHTDNYLARGGEGAVYAVDKKSDCKTGDKTEEKFVIKAKIINKKLDSYASIYNEVVLGQSNKLLGDRMSAATSLVGVFRDDQTLYIVFLRAIMNLSDFNRMVHKYVGSWPENALKWMIYCVGSHLANNYFMAKVVLCDLKPSNILLHRTQHGQMFFQVADFGAALLGHPEDATENKLNICSTIAYAPPEMMRANILDIAKTFSTGSAGVNQAAGPGALDEAGLEGASGDVPDSMVKMTRDIISQFQNFSLESGIGCSTVTSNAIFRYPDFMNLDQCDIWSLGVTVLECMNNDLPFHSIDSKMAFTGQGRKLISKDKLQKNLYSEELLDWIDRAVKTEVTDFHYDPTTSVTARRDGAVSKKKIRLTWDYFTDFYLRPWYPNYAELHNSAAELYEETMDKQFGADRNMKERPKLRLYTTSQYADLAARDRESRKHLQSKDV